jgi:hypothetical protein
MEWKSGRHSPNDELPATAAKQFGRRKAQIADWKRRERLYGLSDAGQPVSLHFLGRGETGPPPRPASASGRSLGLPVEE